jgi:hypothetical protein
VAAAVSTWPVDMIGSLKIIFFLICVVLLGMLFCGMTIYTELSQESSYRSRYGETWRTNFENDRGSLSRSHTRVGLSSFGIVAIGSLTVWLYRLLIPGTASRTAAAKKPKRSRPRFRSSRERTIHARRNGILGVYFGVGGVLVGMLLALFRLGIFSNHDDEIVLGVFVFLLGYAGVLTGCWWWLKAKEWNEAIVFIGLMPLAVFFVPFVRLIVLAMPQILVAGMVMMPAILIVVVFVLPDKSGASRRSWDHD